MYNSTIKIPSPTINNETKVKDRGKGTLVRLKNRPMATPNRMLGKGNSSQKPTPDHVRHSVNNPKITSGSAMPITLVIERVTIFNSEAWDDLDAFIPLRKQKIVETRRADS